MNNVFVKFDLNYPPFSLSLVLKKMFTLLVFILLLIVIPPSYAQTTITKSITTSSDDAEEAGPDATGSYTLGTMDLSSTDIELNEDHDTSGGYSSGTQKVGLRFTGITVPKGAIITTAYLTFRAVAPDAPMTNSQTTNVTIHGHLTANSTTFTSTNNDISNRTLSAAAVTWSTIPSWTTGVDYNSPSIVSIIQEIINQGSWVSGNALSIIITGTGHRSANSYNGNAANSPKLVITYTVPSNRYCVGNGNWNSTSTWSATSGGESGASVPVAGDTVYIGEASFFTVSIPSGYSAACASLKLGSSSAATNGYLIFSDVSSTLTVSGNIDLYQAAGNWTREIDVYNGTLNINGNLNMNVGASSTSSGRVSRIIIWGGTVNVAGNLTFNNVASGSPLQNQIDFKTYAGTFNLGGNFNVINNLGTVVSSTLSTFNFNGTSAQTIPIGVSSIVYNNININNTSYSGAVLIGSITATNVTGNINIQSGTLDNGGFSIVGNASKIFSISNSATFRLTGTSGIVTGFGTKTINGQSIIDYAGSNQTISPESYGNLTLSGSGTKTFASGTTGIAGALSLVGLGNKGDGNSLIESISVNTTTNSSTINFNGTSDQTIPAIDYYNLSLSTSGTKYFGSGTVGIAGNLDVSGSATANALTYNDTIEYNGTDQTVRYGFVNKNVIIANGSSVIATTNIYVTNSLIIGSGSSLNMNNYVLTVDGRLINNGSFVSTNSLGCLSFYSKNSGDYNSLNSWSNDSYSGAITPRLPGTVNNDVLIIGNNKTINLTSNVSNLGTVTVDSSGTLNQSGGTASTKYIHLKNGGTYNQSGGELRISHDLKVPAGATFNATTGTVRFIGIMDGQTICTGNIQLNNLIVDASADYKLESGDEIKISGNYTNNNPSLDNNAGKLIFNGTLPQTIFSSSSPASTNTMAGNLAVSNPNVTMLSDIGIQTSLTFNSGGHINKNGYNIYLNGLLYTGPTPVELISFNASVKNNSVLLSWKTATEVNNYGFEIERSSNNETFIRHSFIRGSGNSNSDKHYTFTDNNLQNGIYYYRLKQLDTDGQFSYSDVVKATIDYTPNSFTLSQNYPNPFNPSTKISWQSPVSGWQTLKVYDILGNEVATLVNEFKEAGYYQIDFDAMGLSTGVYLYKISAGDFSETRKMILSK